VPGDKMQILGIEGMKLAPVTHGGNDGLYLIPQPSTAVHFVESGKVPRHHKYAVARAIHQNPNFASFS